MKVLIFSIFDGLPCAGEEPMRYAALAEEFLSNGHEVVYVTSSFSHVHKKNRTILNSSRDNLKIVLLPGRPYYKNLSLDRILNHYHLSLSLHSWLEKCGSEDPFNLVIGASPPIFANHVLAMFCKKNKVPFIYDIQDLWPEELIRLSPFKKALRFVLKPYFKTAENIIKMSSAVVAVSSEYLHYYKKEIDHKPAEVFPLGIDSHNFVPLIKTDNPTPDVKKIMMLGNAQFGPYVIMAAKAIQNIPNSELVICGMKERSEAIKKILIRKGFQRVSLIEWLSQRELQETLQEYAAGLIWINPRSKIAFPNRAFMYFAAGLPVISNIRNGDLEKYINENKLGVTANTDTDNELEMAIRFCIENFPIEEHNRIQEFAQAHFNRKDIYKRYYDWAVEMINNQ